MAVVDLYDINKQKVGEIELDDSIFSTEVKEHLFYEVVKMQMANRRGGTASTKTRSFVRGGGRKPWRQKGTGRARQGSSRSPLLVGGGTMFGPTPRDFSQKVNKNMKKVAIKSVLADKLQAGKLTVIDQIESDGKTKNMYKQLNGKGLLPALIVTSSKDSMALRAVKNLQYGKGMAVEGFSVYEAVKYENLVIEKQALETLLGKLV